MIRKAIAWTLVAGCAVLVATTNPLGAADENSRKRAEKLFRDSNWAEALEIYRDLLEDDQRIGEPKARAADLMQAVQCVQRLGLWGELDGLVEAAVDSDPKNWRLLVAAATAYQGAPHQGWLSGEDDFTRDQRNREGRYVVVFERDRARTLQTVSAGAAGSPRRGPGRRRRQ